MYAAVIRRGDRYLVCKRAAHKRHGNLWEFPGGKRLDGEPMASAIARELAEELALSTTAVGEVLFERSDPGTHYRIIFVSVEVDGDPAPTEHTAIAWLPPQSIRRLPLAPTDAAFADTL